MRMMSQKGAILRKITPFLTVCPSRSIAGSTNLGADSSDPNLGRSPYDQSMAILRLLKYPLLIVIAILACLACFFLGSKHALAHLSIRQITPTQAANAMKDDHFWSSYREDTLIITGEVLSVNKSGGTTIVSFKTDSTYGMECSFAYSIDTITKGQTVRVTAIANSGERESSSVRLNNCVLQ